MGKDKPIWRLAFFSRLEERKGIKLFVDAVSALNVTGLPNFEVRSCRLIYNDCTAFSSAFQVGDTCLAGCTALSPGHSLPLLALL